MKHPENTPCLQSGTSEEDDPSARVVSHESEEPESLLTKTEDLFADNDPEDGLFGHISSVLGDLGERLTQCQTKIESISTEVQRIKTDDEVLNEMNHRCQILSEQFHEREVLNPILLILIGVADRCRTLESGIESVVAKLEAKPRSFKKTLLRQLLDARRADRVEIESALADLGVQSYEHPGGVFTSSLQTCKGSISCSDFAQKGRIAKRLRPGYRRNEHIIRRECVAVFVTREAKPLCEGEEQ